MTKIQNPTGKLKPCSPPVGADDYPILRKHWPNFGRNGLGKDSAFAKEIWRVEKRPQPFRWGEAA